MTDLDKVLARIDAERDNSLDRLFRFLSIKSISTDPAYTEECRAAAFSLAADLSTLDVDAEVHPTEGHPVVFAKGTFPGNSRRKRVLFYGHYDVQPVDPVDLWQTPPFEPRIATLPDGRKAIVARGACDDKGQVMTFIEACRAWKAITGSVPVDVTFVIEGEEECGSKHLPGWLESHKAELAGDIALVCDTGMWDPATPAITTALRGLVYEEVKISAADRDLHSGLFGGAAQNPIRVLAKIIAALHDDNGHITIPNFYDGVEELPDDVKKAWASLGLTAENFLGQVGLGAPAGEKGRLVIEQISSRPTCDVNGIVGGYTGPGAKTVIPAEASAKISFRLVGKQDPVKIRDAFRAFVGARLPADCKATFTDHSGAPAIALDWHLPQLAKARAALTQEWGKEAVLIGSGGSIPVVADFKRYLGIDTLLIGFGLDDDRIHSPNEKYDLTSFHKGTRSWARILAALAG
ncbi:MAG TPA: M20/M25/M40 family metallo-hydrolase [Xanthobacteraceae bacterium]|nr:M20/M25/M40 family metallo-hydrolase [Xanthobacteraceae bacterium]